MSGIVLALVLLAQAALASCIRLPPAGAGAEVGLQEFEPANGADEDFQEYQTLEQALASYRYRPLPVAELRRIRAATVCSDSLPQMSEDVAAGHHPDFKRAVDDFLGRNAYALTAMPQESCAAVEKMLSSGLRWNALGMDFSKLFQRRDVNINATISEIATHVVPYYYGECPSCEGVMRHDFANRYGKPPRTLDALSYFKLSDGQRFRRDGFFQFDDLGVDAAFLQRQTEDLLLGSSTRGPTSLGKHLDGLEPLINNQHILDLATHYLGTKAVMTGYKILRMPVGASRHGYISGYWHHDSCGSRLKLFVFLQDVADDGIPTAVAVGSQHTLFYGFGNAGICRYAEDYVTNQYRVQKMLGPRGGGFIFDTNTVHRGLVDGKHLQRDAVIIDISAENKLHDRVPPRGPCPEKGTYRIPRPS